MGWSVLVGWLVMAQVGVVAANTFPATLVIAELAGDDAGRTATRRLEAAVRDELAASGALDAFVVRRSDRSFAVGADDDPAAVERADLAARRLLRAIGGDVLLWGEVDAGSGLGRYRISTLTGTTRAIGKPQRFSPNHVGPAGLGGGHGFVLAAIAIAPLAVVREERLLAPVPDDTALGQAMARAFDVFARRLREMSALEFAPEGGPRGAYASALATLGYLNRQPADLQFAATALERAIAATSRETHAAEWGRLQSALGSVLVDLGELTADDNLLPRAIDAYRSALQVRTRQAMPQEWASTVVGLAWPLMFSDNQVEAVELLRAALEVRGRDLVPYAWMDIQKLLGRVHSHLASSPRAAREDAFLAHGEGVQAFRDALRVIDREADPWQWMEVQVPLTMAMMDNLLDPTGDPRDLKAMVPRLRELADWYGRLARPPVFQLALINANLAWALMRQAEVDRTCDLVLEARKRQREARQLAANEQSDEFRSLIGGFLALIAMVEPGFARTCT